MIKASKTLKPPKTLSLEEEVALVRRAQNGDETAIHALVKQYIPLIKSTCRRYRYRDALELEDLEQQCVIYLINAIPKYNLDSGNKFVSFLVPQFQQLSRYILYNGEVLKRPYAEITKPREERSVSAVHSIDRNVSDTDSDESSAHEANFHAHLADDTASEMLKQMEIDQTRDNLYTALEFVTAEYAEVIMMHYLEEMSFVDIGLMLKIPTSRVSDYHKYGMFELKVAIRKLM